MIEARTRRTMRLRRATAMTANTQLEILNPVVGPVTVLVVNRLS